ncbi:hypothetical protein WUBG_16426 [Wuchereria bancrofti]|uniref:Uncharacterized protein n=1 Tax=Wuchereria bancrofti TaxID=6293 RepID=J9DSP7_WUCBA|nr:hypothetical protein WUBG_16426 [Wuchereria bancrofti]
MGHSELRSKRQRTSIRASSGSRNSSKDSERDEDSDEELVAPATPKTSDSMSSDDDDDNDDDDDDDDDDDYDDDDHIEGEIPDVIFNHPLVNDLLDRFMRAKLQNDNTINNINNDKNTGKKLEFLLSIN